MTHLDLFTGIGGFHLAAEWAGFETIGFSEIDPYCCKLLNEKFPKTRNYGDIRTADFSSAKGVTVLSAGVPCQPASLAGKRRGAADDRWLWEATIDVVGCVRPTWCIFENPPGILTLGEFGGVLLRLGTLGYAVRLFSVPANAVGAKHRRQRIFIIGHADSAVVANAQERGIRCGQTQWQSGQFTFSGQGDEALANRTCELFNRSRNAGAQWRLEFADGGQAPADAASRSFGSGIPRSHGAWRLTQPPLCRRTDGVPDRSHRLRALGNAVVPQQAYPFFEAIRQTILMQYASYK